MKLNDRTLTAITAICLAVGVGVAGIFLRTDQSISSSDAFVAAQLQQPAPSIIQQTTLLPTSISPIKPAPYSPFSIPKADWEKRAAEPRTKVFASLTPSGQKPTSVTRVSSRIPADICNVNLNATPKRAARVSLQIIARCHPGTVVTIEHASLRFREMLDSNGELSLIVPAFAEFSEFDITLRDGTKATTAAFIAGLSSLNRIGISWSGNNETFLHASESQAPEDHVWRGQPRSFRQALLEGGGYLTQLGDPTLENPAFAQIYSYPTSGIQQQKFVALSVEIRQQADNCGDMLKIQTARHNPQSGGSNARLLVNLPECGSMTDSLVLKNVVKDMRMARY
ncbi:MAG: hypothetical protein KUG74_11385 [Rhodobacteraceae bacterium]|nr:hypothetical protein [Paracoccaceae bacterium]